MVSCREKIASIRWWECRGRGLVILNRMISISCIKKVPVNGRPERWYLFDLGVKNKVGVERYIQTILMGVGISGERKDITRAKSETGLLGTEGGGQLDWYEGICWSPAFIKRALCAPCFTCVIRPLNTHIKNMSWLYYFPSFQRNWWSRRNWWFRH